MKIIKRLLIIILIGCASQSVMAQQEAMYSQYMFNMLALNPAYAGSRNVTSASALYRDQWVGMEGAPRTTTFTIDAPFDGKRIGLGLQVYNDKIGITNTTGAFVSYAYRIRFNKGTLSFGLQGGASQYRADFTDVPLNSGGGGDNSFSQNIDKLLLNLGTGIYYNSDRFFIGLSSPQLLNNKLDGLDAKGTNTISGQQLHMFFTTGYVFPLSPDLNFKPTVLFKGVKGAPIEADINATLWIKNVLALGAQYRTESSAAAIIELQVSSQFKLGYSYDISTTKLVQYNSGSHEILVRYEFGSQKGKILSPRYF